jgi:ABC-type sugar transport system ATPase subunit
MMNLTLETKTITKEFRGVKALNDMNFCVVEAEVHCLVGENGVLY